MSREVTGTHSPRAHNSAGAWLGRCIIFTFMKRGLKFRNKKKKYKDRQWKMGRDGGREKETNRKPDRKLDGQEERKKKKNLSSL